MKIATVENRFVAASLSLPGGLSAFWNNHRGSTAIEYAIIASSIAAVIAATVFSLGTAVNGLFQSVSSGFH